MQENMLRMFFEVAAEALLGMSGSSHPVLEAGTQGGTKEVATQTKAVSMTNASTCTNDDHYYNVKHSTTMTDINYQDAMLKHRKIKLLVSERPPDDGRCRERPLRVASGRPAE